VGAGYKPAPATLVLPTPHAAPTQHHHATAASPTPIAHATFKYGLAHPNFWLDVSKSGNGKIRLRLHSLNVTR